MFNSLHKSRASPSSMIPKKNAGSEDYHKQSNTFYTNPNSYNGLNSSDQAAIAKTGSSGSKKPRSEKSNTSPGQSNNRTAWYSSDEESNCRSDTVSPSTTSRLKPSENYTAWWGSDNSGSNPPYTESPSKIGDSKLKPSKNYTAWRGSIDSEFTNSGSYYSESHNSEYSEGESYNRGPNSSGPNSSGPNSSGSEIDDPTMAFTKLENKKPQRDDHYTERDRIVFESLLPPHIYNPYNAERLRRSRK